MDYIDREKLMKERDLAIRVYDNANILTAKAIREGLKPLLNKIVDLPKIEVEETTWITVEEKPVKNSIDETILLYVEKEGCKSYITTGYFYSDKFLNNGMCEENGVTHWRPLSVPKKELGQTNINDIK